MDSVQFAGLRDQIRGVLVEWAMDGPPTLTIGELRDLIERIDKVFREEAAALRRETMSVDAEIPF